VALPALLRLSLVRPASEDDPTIERLLSSRRPARSFCGLLLLQLSSVYLDFSTLYATGQTTAVAQRLIERDITLVDRFGQDHPKLR
jgi:hypothetical protein